MLSGLFLLDIFLKPHTYLDPGTGSLLIQILLAGLLGIGVAVRVFWDKIIGLFRKDSQENQEDYDPTSLDDDLTE